MKNSLATVLLLAACAVAMGCGDGETGDGPSADDDGDGSTSGQGGAATSAGNGGGVTGAGGATGAGGEATGAGGGATTGSGGSSGCAQGVDPSCGSGGPLAAGQTGATPLGAQIRLPPGYDPSFASPVVWLFNESVSDWQAIADGDDIVIVDLQEYNDIEAIVDKLNESISILEAQYMVDRARYYWAGWSAGGNIAIIGGSQSQDILAGTMVFPGTGGNLAQPHMQSNQGHKIRLFYACGDQDPNFAWDVVEYEANAWKQLGYETHFEKVVGAPHYIPESTGIRATAWAWMKGFNLQN